MPTKTCHTELALGADERAAAQRNLSCLQQWFQAFIVQPGNAEEAVAAAQALSGWRKTRPADLVLPSATLSPLQRLMIYRDQYLLRMEEALTCDYPVLRRYLGPELFFRFVERYVQVHPSHSHTLSDLGRLVPEFVLKSRFLKHPTLLRDLCLTEWALTSVLDEDDRPALTLERVQAICPEDWGQARVSCLPSLRLLVLKYPVHEWLQAYNDEAEFPELRPRPTWLMIWRRGGDTWRQTLDRPGFELLSRLQDGLTVSAAMDEVLERRRVKPARLFELFSDWLAEGLFCDVTLEAESVG